MTFSDSIGWQTLLSYCADHPGLAVAVFATLQVTLITVIAAGLVRFCRDDPNWAHRIWLSAVVLMLLIVPLHCFSGGWPVSIAQHPTSNSVTPTGQWPGIQYRTEDRMQDAFAAWSTSTTPDETAPAASLVDSQQTESLTRQSIGSQDNAGSSNVLWPQILFGCYFAGVTFWLVRLGMGALRLRSLALEGHTLCDRSKAIVRDASREVALNYVPDVRAVDGLSMPLTFGILRGILLVPRDFDSWPAAEQRAVLMHELAHVKRYDVFGELVARVMQAVYWFHPASSYIARQLVLTRELATDRCVVDCGEDPRSYANSLVAILTRLNLGSSERNIQPPPAVAMSVQHDAENRVLSILRDHRMGMPHTRGRLLIALFLAVSVATTVRLEFVTAQEPPVSQGQTTTEKTMTEKTTTEIATTAPDEAVNATGARLIQPVQAEDNDLFNRMRDCDVLTVTGDEYDAIFTVSGQVLSPTGQPVAGAVVLMRESSVDRIRYPHDIRRKYAGTENWKLFRVPDVFARTTTNDAGEFRFENVKSPAMPNRGARPWEGDLIAGHQQLGIGWQKLEHGTADRHVETDLTIRMHSTSSVSGRYVTPSDQPLGNTVVKIIRIESPALSFPRDPPSKQLDLMLSQLAPYVMTDATGAFSLTNVPQGYVAIVVGAGNADWLGMSAAVATSEYMPLGDRGGYFFRPRIGKLVGSPVTLVADPGVGISGTVVDDAGEPVEGADVSLSSGSKNALSNALGEFAVRLPTWYFDLAQHRKKHEMRFKIGAPVGSDLLSQYMGVPIEDLLSEKAIQIQLERGVSSDN